MAEQLTGEQFLHKRQPKRHRSPEVTNIVSYLRQNGEDISQRPADKLAAYLGFLANKNYVNDGIFTGDEESIERQVKHAIIQREDVPDSYFELQKRIARERGHGDIEIDDFMKTEMVRTIQEEQAESLSSWANYLSSETNTVYPKWFKAFVWESVRNLGEYNKQKQTFVKRSRGTTSPFPELNAEALSYVFEVMETHTLGGEPFDSDKISSIARHGSFNFGKLYAHALIEVTPANPEIRKITDGKWTKYGQIEGDYEPDYNFENGEATDRSPVKDETAMTLAKSLQGHGTGWYTAGTRTAAHQLSQGDFYVFYTKDKAVDGRYVVPRIAIRMENGRVVEVRGIDPDQNLESGMIDIAAEKLDELPGGEDYSYAVEDMKWLTDLDSRIKAGQDISPDDIFRLHFLRIYGFGQEADPRINEILNKRDYEQDVQKLIDSYDNDALAEELLEVDCESVVFDFIERFTFNDPKIPRTVVDRIINSGGAIEVLKKLDACPFLEEQDHIDLVVKLLSRRSAYDIMDNAKHLKINHFVLARDYMSNTNDSIHALSKHLDKLDLSPNELTSLAEHLLRKGAYADVIRYFPVETFDMVGAIKIGMNLASESDSKAYSVVHAIKERINDILSLPEDDKCQIADALFTDRRGNRQDGVDIVLAHVQDFGYTSEEQKEIVDDFPRVYLYKIAAHFKSFSPGVIDYNEIYQRMPYSVQISSLDYFPPGSLRADLFPSHTNNLTLLRLKDRFQSQTTADQP